MRLIDADKLILSLNDFMLVESPTDNASTGERRMSEMVCEVIQHCIEAVDEQPTAYDVEKVVDELEENAITDAMAIAYLAQHKIPFVSKRKALEIIESGGVE